MAKGGRKRPRVAAGDGDGAAAAVVAHPSQPHEEHKEYEVGSVFMSERQDPKLGARGHNSQSVPRGTSDTHHQQLRAKLSAPSSCMGLLSRDIILPISLN